METFYAALMQRTKHVSIKMYAIYSKRQFGRFLPKVKLMRETERMAGEKKETLYGKGGRDRM